MFAVGPRHDSQRPIRLGEVAEGQDYGDGLPSSIGEYSGRVAMEGLRACTWLGGAVPQMGERARSLQAIRDWFAQHIRFDRSTELSVLLEAGDVGRPSGGIDSDASSRMAFLTPPEMSIGLASSTSAATRLRSLTTDDVSRAPVMTAAPSVSSEVDQSRSVRVRRGDDRAIPPR